MGKIFYISDLHLGHTNVLRLSKRPFGSIEEMDKALIDNWNKVVSDEDDVYIIGDFCYKSAVHPKTYLNKLKGKKHLIIGNHDGFLLKQVDLKKYFVSVDNMLSIMDGTDRVVMCHYPMCEWDGFFRGTVHLFGHIHNNKQDTFLIMKGIKNAYNVGVDILDYYPRTLSEVKKYNDEFNK